MDQPSNIVRVPKPAKASFNPDRPLHKNSLLASQVRHCREIEGKLPSQKRAAKKFKNIERAMGRKKVKKRWGARIIDLDILLYDSAVLKKKNLKIPHPEMPTRKFVLIPPTAAVP